MDRYPPGLEYQPRAETALLAAAALAAWTVVDTNVDIRLITEDFALTPAMTFAGLVEASFPGYTKKTVLLSTFTLQQFQGDGSVRQQSTVLAAFPGPTSGGTVTVYGVAYTEENVGAPARLYRVVQFLQPVQLPNDDTFLNVIPMFSFRTGDQG